MARDFYVILPSRSPVMAERCLRSLFAVEPDLPRSRIIVQAAWPEIYAGGSLAGIVWQPQQSPFCLSREWQAGVLKAPPSKDVVLLEDDVTFYPDHPKPLTWLAGVANVVGGRALIHPSVIGEGFGNSTLIYGKTPHLKFEPIMVPLICAYVPIELREAGVGLPDDRFDKYGSEDDDFCYRVRRAGLPIVVPDWLPVQHDASQGGYRAAGGPGTNLKENRAKFVAKWGQYPPPFIPYGPGVPPF